MTPSRRRAMPAALVAAVLGAVVNGCGADEDDYGLRTPPPRVGAEAIVAPPPASSASPATGTARSGLSPAAKARARGVLTRWADALRRGDERAAARYFAVPALIAQGQVIRLNSRLEVRRFNAGLPCGARLLEVGREGRYVTGVFRLTRRPDNDCGADVGELVRVAFLIRGGKFTEWRAVPLAPGSLAPEPVVDEGRAA